MKPTIAIVLTTFNDAAFLRDSIASVLAQSSPPDEIVVVDDGSTEDPAPVLAAFSGVRLIRQENQGLSGARNTGLAAVRAEHVAFLDADDLLERSALASGLAAFAAHPRAAFVYGAHRVIDASGRVTSRYLFRPIAADPYGSLLRRNVVGMHATVLYRRDALAEAGGFDRSLRKCEDYDVYLRLARMHPVAAHPSLVASYRKHGSNMSRDTHGMLEAALTVLAGQEAFATAPEHRRALAEGRRLWRAHYARVMLNAALGQRLRGRDARLLVRDAFTIAPAETTSHLARAAYRAVASRI